MAKNDKKTNTTQTPSVETQFPSEKSIQDNQRSDRPIQRPTKEYIPSEYVIKEIMIQKKVTREQAIEILKNPAK